MAALRSNLRQMGLAALLVLMLFSTQALALGPRDTSLTGAMGSATVDGEQYYRITMRPEIPVGNWGVALDIELFITPDGGISSRGWQFGSATRAVDSFLRKIYYVRYGHPRDPLYVRVGALDDVTLGYGLIMDGYSNAMEYPGVKKTGVVLNMENVAGSGLNLQGMINHVQDFQAGGALVGLRAWRRAVGRIELGATGVIDLNQYSGVDEVVYHDPTRDMPESLIQQLRELSEEYPDDPRFEELLTRREIFNRDKVDAHRFGMVGLDAAYPLINGRRLSLRLYGQWAMLLDDSPTLTEREADSLGVAPGITKAEGWGIGAPGLWWEMGSIRAQLEFRHFVDDFNSGYFDRMYELDRARLDRSTGRIRTKSATLTHPDRARTQSGVYGKLTGELWGLLRTTGSYQYLTGGDDPNQQLTAEVRVTDRILRDIPRLDDARAYYRKTNIGIGLSQDGTDTDGFFEPTEDTYYGYAVQMRMVGDLAIVWDTRYVFDRDAEQQRQRRRNLSIETVFRF